jgi:ribosome-interacting GTPase 1
MPANLPPQYMETEKKLKTARTPEEKIAIYEELLAIIPKHKGTDKLQALLKTKIAKQKALAQKKPVVGRRGPTFTVEKQGAGQVVLIGPPNSGKSSIIKALTNFEPDIGSYPFTTHTPAPAMMDYVNIQIQLVDTPPISPEYIDTWHSELIKSSDGILIVLDLGSEDPGLDLLALYEKWEEKNMVVVPPGTEIVSANQIRRGKIMIVANKTDLPDSSRRLEELADAFGEEYPILAVSAEKGDHMEELRQAVYDMLGILRVYSKIPGKKADLNEPFVFKIGSTVMDMARTVHRDFASRLKFARIWGQAKFDGQKVNRDYILQEGDVIELHL